LILNRIGSTLAVGSTVQTYTLISAHPVSGGSGWINDPNLRLMLTNGAKWAAECP
jgi:hypothetical protein